jgi:hypothetical protein
MVIAQATIESLVEHGFAHDEGAGWMRAEQETRAFLKERWNEISRVANALAALGKLTATEVIELVDPAPQRP